MIYPMPCASFKQRYFYIWMELATHGKKKPTTNQKQNTDENAEALTFVFLSIPNSTKFALSFIFKIITSVQFA